jgi:hypothetical protein
LTQTISARVTASVLSLLIKGGVKDLKPESVIFLTANSLFSSFETYQPEEISSQLKRNYEAVEEKQTQQWVDTVPGLSTSLA